MIDHALPNNPIPPENRPKRATREELRARVYQALKLTIDGLSKSDIKRAFKKQYGVGSYQVERYLRLARGLAIKNAKKSHEELVAESYATYRGILADKGATNKEKIAAQRSIDRLFGLPKPFKVAPVMPDGKSPFRLAVDTLSSDQLESLVAAMQAAEQHSALVAGVTSAN